jgi:galactose mutarotase-like enzyme
MPARVHSFRGLPAVTLSGDELRATFLPEHGMLGASLRWRGREFVSLHGGLDVWRDGHTTGVPLLAPWANRLGADRYRVGSTLVDLRGARHLSRDGNGLPIHGTMLGEHRWDVVRVESDDAGGSLAASFDFGGHPALLRSFPFPHSLEIEATVVSNALSLVTSLRATGRRSVPVTFGWHPYFRLPGVKRADLVLGLPSRHRLELDDRQLPTGRERREPAKAAPLASHTFDDGYRLGRDRRFTIEGERTRLSVTFDRRFAFAQIFAPRGTPFVAVEPMTAPTNALVTGDYSAVSPGGCYRAGFEVTITTT